MGHREYACIAIWLEKFAPLRLDRNLSQLSFPDRHLGIVSWPVYVVRKAGERDCGESTKIRLGWVHHYRMTFSSGPLG